MNRTSRLRRLERRLGYVVPVLLIGDSEAPPVEAREYFNRHGCYSMDSVTEAKNGLSNEEANHASD